MADVFKNMSLKCKYSIETIIFLLNNKVILVFLADYINLGLEKAI